MVSDIRKRQPSGLRLSYRPVRMAEGVPPENANSTKKGRRRMAPCFVSPATRLPEPETAPKPIAVVDRYRRAPDGIATFLFAWIVASVVDQFRTLGAFSFFPDG
jgi:hypothetical protein